MKAAFYTFSLIGAILASLFLYVTIHDANGAPQEAAGAAMAACIVIIPYVFARSFEKLLEPKNSRDLLEKQVKQNRQMIVLQKKHLGIGLTDDEKTLLTK